MNLSKSITFIYRVTFPWLGYDKSRGCLQYLCDTKLFGSHFHFSNLFTAVKNDKENHLSKYLI